MICRLLDLDLLRRVFSARESYCSTDSSLALMRWISSGQSRWYSLNKYVWDIQIVRSNEIPIETDGIPKNCPSFKFLTLVRNLERIFTERTGVMFSEWFSQSMLSVIYLPTLTSCPRKQATRTSAGSACIDHIFTTHDTHGQYQVPVYSSMCSIGNMCMMHIDQLIGSKYIAQQEINQHVISMIERNQSCIHSLSLFGSLQSQLCFCVERSAELSMMYCYATEQPFLFSDGILKENRHPSVGKQYQDQYTLAVL